MLDVIFVTRFKHKAFVGSRTRKKKEFFFSLLAKDLLNTLNRSFSLNKNQQFIPPQLDFDTLVPNEELDLLSACCHHH